MPCTLQVTTVAAAGCRIEQYWKDWKSNSLTDKQISGDKWREENVENKQKKEG
jgi:hypothetical protein